MHLLTGYILLVLVVQIWGILVVHTGAQEMPR